MHQATSRYEILGVLMGFSWVTMGGVSLMGKTLKFGVLRVSNVVNDVDNHVGTTFGCFLS